jgi:lipid-A-disaccharide synthase
MLKDSCLIIAGEKSGEEHAMSFFPRLKAENPDCDFFGVGGDDLIDQGVECLYHLRDFSSWGFSEVIGKIPFYYKALKRIVSEVDRRGTKVAILIDFQDFNMRLAKKLKNTGVEVLYYVAPQAWAWKPWRANALQRDVNTLFTILPFEKEWFSKRGVRHVQSAPHPLYFHYKDEVNSRHLEKKHSSFKSKVRVLILPGSRNFEVQNLLGEFIKAARSLNGPVELGIVVSPNVSAKLYRPYLKFCPRVFDHSKLPDALEWADMAMAASGTVTLSCALFQVPTVVCYKTSHLNEFIFSNFLSYSGPISLANIVHEDSVFPELLQNSVSQYNIAVHLQEWIDNEEKYNDLQLKLGKTLSLISGDQEGVVMQMHKVMLRAFGKGDSNEL